MKFISRLLDKYLYRPQALRHMMGLVGERPLDINIDTSTYCPMRCVFCFRTKFDVAPEVMSMELFEKICADYYAVGGGGLSINSMHADVFFDPMLFDRMRVLERYRKRLYLFFTTNLLGASKLDDKQLERVLGLFSLLQVSLGGVTRETYREMFGVDAFDTVLLQLKRIARLRELGRCQPEVRLYFRVPDKNKLLGEPLYRELANRFIVEEVRDSFFSWGGLLEQKDLPEGCTLVTQDNANKREDCVVPWASLNVDPGGKAIGCGCIDYRGSMQIGDLAVESILDIWNSDRARRFRECFSRGESPAFCHDCHLYRSLPEAFGHKYLRRYHPLDGVYYCEKRSPRKNRG